MFHAYVGIVDCYGLEALLPEEEDSLPRLAANLSHRQNYQPVCFWAVITPNVLRLIATALDRGNRIDAWLTLEACAEELGPLCHPRVDWVA